MKEIFPPLFPLELESGLGQALRHRFKSRERRSIGGSPKAVENTTEDTRWGLIMNVGVVTVQITQARLKAESPCFENEEAVRSHLREGVADPKLKGHVETGDFEIARECDPAEVMHRSATTRDESEDPFQTAAAAARDLQHTARSTADPRQAGYERQEKRAVLRIEGNVQKYVLIVIRSFGIREWHSDRANLSRSSWCDMDRTEGKKQDPNHKNSVPPHHPRRSKADRIQAPSRPSLQSLRLPG